jgi:Protein of unknown function (DUF402)
VTERFKAGEWVELREVWDGRTWELRQGIVVDDRPDVVAVYTPPSAPALVAAGADGTRLRLPPPDWSLAEAVTPADRHFLAVHPLGAEHSVLAIWDNDWRFLCWYINLESDLVRTATGFEYEDHVLDVIVEEGLKSWHWKDEDELGEALARGLFTREQLAAFYAEGERAAEWLMARRAPYDTLWENWRPSS